MDLFILTLLSFLLGGSGNDLLDYVPTDVYWKAKQVNITAAAMASELNPITDADVARWIDELDAADPQVRTMAYQRLLHAGPVVLPRLTKISQSDNPEPSKRATQLIGRINAAPRRDAVRRLMAIRALGELKNADALPALRPLLLSKEMFVADYASASIAQVQGNPGNRDRAQGTEKDVWLLPADCRAVVHLNLRSGHALDYEQVFKQLPLTQNQDKGATIDYISGHALNLAEIIGNVRLDAVTVGASADLDDRAGNMMFILAGQFDSPALANLARQQKVPFTHVDGTDVYHPDADTSVFFPSDRRLAIVSTQKHETAPVAALVSAMKTGEGKLKTDDAMAKLIAPLDLSAPMWGVMHVTDAYRKAAMLQSFDAITLIGVHAGDGIHLTFSAQGTDAAKVKAAVAEITEAAHHWVQQVRRMQTVMPGLKVLADGLAGVTVVADGKMATLHAGVKESPEDSFLLPLMMTYGIPQRHEEVMPKE